MYTEKSVLGNSNITYGLVYGTLATRNSGRAENIIVNGEMNIWFVGRNTSKFGGLFGTNSGTVMNSQVLATANPTRNLHN